MEEKVNRGGLKSAHRRRGGRGSQAWEKMASPGTCPPRIGLQQFEAGTKAFGPLFKMHGPSDLFIGHFLP